ncbi:nitrate/nitrite transporter NrtS [Altererythrobacter sp. MF3-039]|uniref:nitrate/nitrite transporter NrtS n=1 Tax=Altererythrobacter sp. MF3-039 TaxID=3252901 RepID=UPI00390C7116
MINRNAFKNCFAAPVAKRSLGVAIVVGTILTAINQGDLILAGRMPVLWKVALTYLVPYFVATYGAYAALANRNRD